MVPVESGGRAPTKDVARSSCVSKQWRDIVTNPSFRKLHHDRHAAPPKGDVPYALLVSTDSVDGESVSTVFPAALVSPAVMTGGFHAPIYRVSNAYGYHLANVCNGFLCFASWSGARSSCATLSRVRSWRCPGLLPSSPISSSRRRSRSPWGSARPPVCTSCSASPTTASTRTRLPPVMEPAAGGANTRFRTRALWQKIHQPLL
ncbi:Os05g0570700 [Oryza sativa Japonica Group]|uniref:Os05g0570700 protein n=1 Tax=Oryza sativa subsp. japonica TaxID=39947 RepID=A0A0P0WR27_ORYSJ|nr:Os05g0570700 [Oryza sativa Japonica Group]